MSTGRSIPSSCWKITNTSAALRVRTRNKITKEQAKIILLDFLSLLTIASILAGIGLITNSSVIIVASMLVSPIMGPVMGNERGPEKGLAGRDEGTIEEGKWKANPIINVARWICDVTNDVGGY